MPIDNIPVSGSSAKGNEIKNLNSLLFSAKGIAEQILAQMQEMNDNSNYATLETQYGIGTGSGATVYSLVFSLANGNPASPSGFGNGAFTQFMNRIN